MKPKPFGRSVARSIAKLHESTTPTSLKRVRSSSLVVSSERLPTNNLVDMIIVLSVKSGSRPSGSQEGLRRAGRLAHPQAASGSLSSDLVESRIGNLKAFHLWSSVNHFRQGLQHFRVRRAGISFGVLFRIPEADG